MQLKWYDQLDMQPVNRALTTLLSIFSPWIQPDLTTVQQSRLVRSTGSGVTRPDSLPAARPQHHKPDPTFVKLLILHSILYSCTAQPRDSECGRLSTDCFGTPGETDATPTGFVLARAPHACLTHFVLSLPAAIEAREESPVYYLLLCAVRSH